MNTNVKIIFLSIILTLINGKRNKTDVSINNQKSFDTNKNRTTVEDKVEIFNNKSKDLSTSDQNYDYIKHRDNSYGNNFGDNGRKDRSFLREMHFFRNKETTYEKNYHWNSESDEELQSKKVKKDLYNKRNYGKNYGFKDDMIEVKTWDDSEQDFGIDYDVKDNNNNNNNYINNKNNYNLNINHNNNNEDYNKIDQKSQNINYIRKYSFEDEGQEGDVYYGGPEGDQNAQDYKNQQEHLKPTVHKGRADNQKWFTNMEDHDSDNTNEIRDEDNYNNFNSPKFVVNFHRFKPWSRLISSKTIDENYSKDSDNYGNNYEMYSNSHTKSEDTDEDDRPVYKPKIITNFKTRIRNKKENNRNNNNYNNFRNNNNNQNDRDVKYKTVKNEKVVHKLKNRPKTVRYHYEKRVSPQIFDSPVLKTAGPRSLYDFPNDRHNSMRDQINRKFIEMPFDAFSQGWSTDNKPMRHTLRRKAVPKVKQYRHGF